MLRVFGETPGGQKACLHIHRLFPYLYVPYDDDLPRDSAGATGFLRGLAEALDRALDFGERAAADTQNTAGGAGGAGFGADGSTRDDLVHRTNASNAPRGGPGDPAARPFAPRIPPARGSGNGSFLVGDGKRRRRAVVHACALVRARSMYGFHAHERLFVKISLYDPACMSRVRAALLSGGVADRTFQPFEAHVPFPLRAMMDLNLTGAGVVRCGDACFREPAPRWPRAHARRVAARRRLRLGGAAMEEEEGLGGSFAESGRVRTERKSASGRRGPVELEYEDVEPTPAPLPTRAEGAEPFGLFGVVGGDTVGGAAETPFERASESTPSRSGDDAVPRGRERPVVTDPEPPPPRVWTQKTIPRRWTRVALRPFRRHSADSGIARGADASPPSPTPGTSQEGDRTPPFVNLSDSDGFDGFDRNTAAPPPRTSNVELEVDALAEAILNARDAISEGSARDGRGSVRLVPSLRSAWDEETRRAALENRAVPPPPPPAPRLAFAETSVAKDETRKRLLARVAAAARAETRAETRAGAGGESCPGPRGFRDGDAPFDLTTVRAWALGSAEASDGSRDGGERARSPERRTDSGDPADAPMASAPPANRASTPASSFATGSQSDDDPSEDGRAVSRARRGSARLGATSQQPSQLLRVSQQKLLRDRRNDRDASVEERQSEYQSEDPKVRLSVDRELVVVSQAAASVSPFSGGTQDDPMYGLLLNFAKGETARALDGGKRKSADEEENVSEAARRVSVAAVAAGAAAREAEEVRDLRREYDDDDDDDSARAETPRTVTRPTNKIALAEEDVTNELDPFVAATQREWDDLQDVLGTAEQTDGDAEARGTAPAVVSPRTNETASTKPPKANGASDNEKICVVCGEDCSRERRVFSRAKGYAHKRCAAFERDVSSAKAKALSVMKKRRASESVAANLFDAPRVAARDGESHPSSPVSESRRAARAEETERWRPAVQSPEKAETNPEPESKARACFHCGDALVGEKGVKSPARGYAHVRCARALGWRLGHKKRRGEDSGPGSGPGAGPNRKTRFAAEAAVSESDANNADPRPFETGGVSATETSREAFATSAIPASLAETEPFAPTGVPAEEDPGAAVAAPSFFALRPRLEPPTAASLRASAASLGVPETVHEEVFYGDPRDAPARAAIVGGVPLWVPTNRPEDLRAFSAATETRKETRLDSYAPRTFARATTTTTTKLAAAFPHTLAEPFDDAPVENVEMRPSPRRAPRYALRPLRPPPRRDQVERYARRRGFRLSSDPEKHENPRRTATPEDPATPRDLRDRATVPFSGPSRSEKPPPSPFHPPARVSLRASLAASPAVGSGPSPVEEEGPAGPGAGPAANARLDAWLDSLDSVGDAAGPSGGVGSGRGQSGPAQIGLGDAADAADADERRTSDKSSRSVASDAGPGDVFETDPAERPPSPKYEEQNGYLEHLRFHGCEAHVNDAETDRLRSSVRDGDTPSRPVARPRASAAVAIPSSAKPPPPRGGFRRRVQRLGASQVTQPTDAAHSTPRSDSVGMASERGAGGVPGGRARVAGAPVPPMGVLCVETIGGTRGELLPDPNRDPVLTVGLCFSADGGATRRRLALALTRRGRRGGAEDGEGEAFESESESESEEAPAWAWGPEHAVPGDVECHAFDDERALLRGFAATVLALDPDVLVGFEVQSESLGFLADRARRLDIDLLRLISRSESLPGANERQDDEYGRLHASGIYVTGRIVLNLWRVLRGELKLQSYAFESCVSAVLRRRVPRFSAKTLSRWASGGGGSSPRRDPGSNPNGSKESVPSSHQRWRAIRHACARATLVSQMCEQLDVVARTNEQAKIFGIDFQSVVFRGSQYRVESMMLRLAHLENYLAPSPSAEQTSRQPAMECLPLVMEPESKLYVDPVAVLDFASLYPSVVCAYNLCYSTCLGKVPDQRDLDALRDDRDDDPKEAGLRTDQVAGLGGGPPRKLGCHELALPPGLLPAMMMTRGEDGPKGEEKPPGVVVTPNGAMFAPRAVRPGILPRLLSEILDTRVMVKSCLKDAPADAKARRRALNAKQFGLKLIANVTYGYTAAGFSGRMPMAELADAIVQCGRDTLERAIRVVHSGDARWRGARVVYGDTDSLFVHFPGYSKASAFEAAAAIADAVTADNPPPVTLKLEKVYHPCILATKKRYVGHAYETPTQRAPLFDAKGIEVVRRDTCPLLVKTQRTALQLLFHNKDLSLVKRYVQRHVAKLRAGRIPLGDLVFAKETRLGTYSKTPGAQKPPAAIVAESLMAADPRAEPKFGERVPYVVVCGEPGGRLMDMIAHPRAVASSRGTLIVNAKYYGDKVIAPAMQRLLGLVGADVHAWLREPATLTLGHASADFAKRALAAPAPASNARRNIDQFFLSARCALCGELTEAPRVVCEACAANPGAAAATLAWRAAALERDSAKLARVCLGCGGGGGAVEDAGFAFRGCGGGGGGGGSGDPGLDFFARTSPSLDVSSRAGAVECVSLDCDVFFARRKAETELHAAAAHVDAAFRLGGGLHGTR